MSGGSMIVPFGFFRPVEESFDIFVQRFEAAFEANGLEEGKRIPIFVSLLDSEMLKLGNDLFFPSTMREQPYELLVQRIKLHLAPRKKVIPQRCRFLKRVQLGNESVSEYLRELRHLAMDCTFGEMLEVMLRDRFVAGIKSESLQKKLLQEDDDVTLDRVFSIAVSFELAEQNALASSWHHDSFLNSSYFSTRNLGSLILTINNNASTMHVNFIFYFLEFTTINGIRHTKTSPYNPSTNGLAERYVREFKNSLRKNQGKDSIEINLQRFLFTHRAFPQTVLKESPAELLMKRSLRSRFSNLIPEMAKVGEVYHDAMRKQEHFAVGSDVYFRSFANGPKWKRGRIMELLSSRHYLIEDEGRYVKRHINQLRPVIKKEVPEVRDLVLPGTSRDFILPGTSRDHPRLGGQEKTMEEAPEVDEELKGAESSAQEDTPEPEPGPAAAAVPVPKMDQKSGEAISKYIIRLKEQAQRCNFGDFLQESLRDRFVVGIIDTPTQKKLLQEEGLTFEGALDIALSAESADNDLHNLKRSEDAHRSPQHLHAINNPCKHCGRYFLNLFNISFNYLHKLDSFSIDSLLNDYESIFECKSDPIKGIKCHLDVRADFIPKFYKFRQVPFALKQLVENEIDKLVDLNIMSPIDKSDCASPLVCVAKPNGQIRLCADFKKSLNPYLEDVKYPIPNIDSVLSNFQGKKLFTKLDLSKAYHQIEMDDISKKYLVVSTHKGLYKYNRLAFGIKTASEIFQKTMESFFSGIRDVYIYFDDILIASEDLESHLDILKRTLNILKENNFTINKNKCLFVKNEIEYLGHKINELGIYPLKDKLACIKNCPVPKNITELKSFLGFLSFYSKFLPNLSDLAYPLYNLLKKNVKWSWNAGTDRSFNSCKNALDETTCLSHYSLNLPLILSCDASQVGIGATLSHLKDGEERPVCFISRTLNVHERKYSQVEREGLAIVFAVNKLKNYLFGRKFTIYTDHKPLITIFGDKTNLPPLIANRLHRWALTLSNYSFEIEYKKGKDNIIPDFLSRFPECQEDNLEYNDGSGEILLLNTSIIDHVLVAHETQLDRTLFKLYKIIETGELPSSPNDDLIPYLKRIDDFTILQECIFLESRMVIPKSLHERVLQLLHESHAGTNKMKMMAPQKTKMAEYNVLSQTKIEPLTGNNYQIWALKIGAVLRGRKLFKCVISDPEPDMEDKSSWEIWSDKNDEAFGIIITTLTNEQAGMFIGETNAKKVWDSLRKTYTGNLEDKIIDIGLELKNIRMKDNETVDEYITRAKNIAARSSSLGHQFPSRELSFHIVRGIHPRYENIAIVLRSKREATIEEIQQTLREEESRRNMRLNQPVENGHEQAYRIKDRKVQQSQPKRCFVCNKKGHLANDCWFRDKQKQGYQKKWNPGYRNHKYSREHSNNLVDTMKSGINEQAFETYVKEFEDSPDERNDRQIWCIDSGCTAHLTPNLTLMENVVDYESEINLAEKGKTTQAIAKGDMRLTTCTSEGQENIRIKDILHVPSLRNNFLSVYELVNKGNSVIFNKDGAKIYNEGNDLVAEAYIKDRMFMMETKQRNVPIAKNENVMVINTHLSNKNSNISLWHKRLNHINEEYMKKMIQGHIVRGLDLKFERLPECEACIMGKLVQKPYNITENYTVKPLQLIHMDLCGPMPCQSLGGSKYFLVIVDDYSRRIFVYFLRSKDETFERFEEFKARAENELSLRIKDVRTDNGTEFCNSRFEGLFKRSGIHHQLTTTYSPQSNGVAERVNRTLIDTARTLLIDSKLPMMVWAEAIATATYIKNCTPHRSIKQNTPMQRWNGRKPSVKHIRIFGCLTHWLESKPRRNKFSPKGRKGIFIGYSIKRKAYRIYDIMTKRIHEVRSVKFSEDKRGIDYANDIQEDTTCDNLTYKGNCEEIVAEDFLILKEDNPVTESKMKSQEDTSVKLGGDCENDSSQTEPIQERCVKGGRKKGETKSILEERHKARLEEQERKLIEEGVRRSQRIKDRNNANLIMEIDHYIPENFKEAMDSGERNEWHKAMEDELSEIEKHKVWTLVPRGNGMKVINSKWVYSTKKTPTDGIYKRKARLVAVGCNQRYGVDYKESFSPVLKKESLRTIVALATQQNLTIKTYDVKTAYLYDDLIIAGTSKEINDNLASEIEKYVTLTEKKDSEPFIGIEIKREEDGFYLSQTHYIDTILHRFGLEECNSVQTPGDQNQNLDEYLDSKPVDKTVYQEMIGSLMYLSTGTRPDISFNVSNLSQYSNDPREIHLTGVKRIYRYLKGTRDNMLAYKSKDNNITISTDASWCTTRDAKSYSGYTVKLGNNLINWRSRKQNLVALSTCEAELISICEGISEVLWLKGLLEELCENLTFPITLKSDSQAAINWIQSDKITSRTKHINR
ncbi:hypothetical protein LAZ67_8002382, partial [Cordylochernes scorpioides]